MCRVKVKMAVVGLSLLVISLGSSAGSVQADEREAQAHEPEQVRMLVTRGGAWNVAVQGGKDAGIFEKHGIDPQIEIVTFSTLLTELPTKGVPFSVYSGIAGIKLINKGHDLVVIAGGLVSGQIFVATDSPTRSVKDLVGKKIGTSSVASSAFQIAQAAVKAEFGVDLLDREQFTIIESPPPALLPLLIRGEIDAMINITGPSVYAASQPDKVRPIFWPTEYWRKKTGVPIAWSTPILAWREWVDASPDRARRLGAAIHESYEWLRKHPDDAVAQLAEAEGREIGPAEAAEYKAWLEAGTLFVPKWDQQTIDAQWEFLEVVKEAGIISEVPPKERHAIPVH